jgi:hypothetical protein
VRGRRQSIALVAVLVLSACAVTLPSSPTVMALPAQGKSLAQFQQEDISCRNHAQQQTANAPTAPKATDYSLQQRYDIAYTQCLYADGNKITSAPAGGYSAYPGYSAYAPYPYYGPGFYGGPVLGFGFGSGWYGGYRGGWMDTEAVGRLARRPLAPLMRPASSRRAYGGAGCCRRSGAALGNTARR